MGKKRCNPVTKVLFYKKVDKYFIQLNHPHLQPNHELMFLTLQNEEATFEATLEDLAEFAPSKIFHENLFVLLRLINKTYFLEL